MAAFAANGLRFQYPENWQLEREESESGWTVSLQSPDTAFLTISIDADLPSTENMADTALAAMRDEYPDLESSACTDLLAGQPAVGHDVQFFSFDLVNTCRIRSFYSAQGTVLVFWQINDLELDKNEPILRAICESLRIDEE